MKFLTIAFAIMQLNRYEQARFNTDKNKKKQTNKVPQNLEFLLGNLGTVCSALRSASDVKLKWLLRALAVNKVVLFIFVHTKICFIWLDSC